MLVWQAHKNFVRRIVFLGDGRTVATTAGLSRFVWVWDAGTRAPVRKLDAHRPPARAAWVQGTRAVEALAASADGRRLMTVNVNAEAKVWAAATGDELHGWWLRGNPGEVALAPDGATAAVGGWDRTAAVFDLTRPADEHGAPPAAADLRRVAYRLAYSPDGKWIAGHGHHGLTLWHTATYQPFDRPAKPRHVGPIVFSPDGNRIAAVRGAEVYTWVRDKWAAGPVVRGIGVPVADVAFGPDGRTLLSAAEDGTIRMSDADTGETARTFDFGIGGVRAAAFAPDGLTCAVGGAKGQIVVWDVE